MAALANRVDPVSVFESVTRTFGDTFKQEYRDNGAKLDEFVAGREQKAGAEPAEQES